jgi:hypothetical protein
MRLFTEIGCCAALTHGLHGSENRAPFLVLGYRHPAFDANPGSSNRPIALPSEEPSKKVHFHLLNCRSRNTPTSCRRRREEPRPRTHGEQVPRRLEHFEQITERSQVRTEDRPTAKVRMSASATSDSRNRTPYHPISAGSPIRDSIQIVRLNFLIQIPRT